MPAIAVPTLSDGVIGVRPLRPGDVPAIVAACQDPEIPRWTEVPSPYTREDAERFLAIAATDARVGSGAALAVTGADGVLIGTVGLFGISRQTGRAELGYWTAAPARGRGVARRSVVLLRDWAQATLGLTRFELLVHPENLASRRVALAAGFADTGRLRAHKRRPEPLLVYAWAAPSA